MKIVYTVLLLVFFYPAAYGQKQVLDSLQHRLAHTQVDTSRVLLLVELCVRSTDSNLDSAVSYGQQAAFGLANPQHALGSAIHYFSKVADKFTRTGARTSYNVGRIGGGTSVNSIAFESWMEVDMRSEIPENLNLVDSLLKVSVQQALQEHNAMRRSGPVLTVDIAKIGDRPTVPPANYLKISLWFSERWRLLLLLD